MAEGGAPEDDVARFVAVAREGESTMSILVVAPYPYPPETSNPAARPRARPLGALYTWATFARCAAAVVVIYSAYTRRSTNARVDSRSA